MKKRNEKGFTLVELIVVMAVLAIISAIAVPRFIGVQDKAKEDADYATGAMIAKAAELYFAKEEDAVSPVLASELVTANYINGIEFKSETFKDYTADQVQVTFEGTGNVTVVASDGTDTDYLYPRSSGS
ncbi:MAG: type II secretion system protein [Sedimentibacter sp.]|uniref:competence type IV pilus major pilin ComGC n=1 Tax=Sedimentibacter sp. TaxID=1960295 RepID=UPI0031588E53